MENTHLNAPFLTYLEWGIHSIIRGMRWAILNYMCEPKNRMIMPILVLIKYNYEPHDNFWENMTTSN